MTRRFIKSPEPTAVSSSRSFAAKADGAAVAIHAAGRRWLFSHRPKMF
jgi:hypothetical protein